MLLFNCEISHTSIQVRALSDDQLMSYDVIRQIIFFRSLLDGIQKRLYKPKKSSQWKELTKIIYLTLTSPYSIGPNQKGKVTTIQIFL